MISQPSANKEEKEKQLDLGIQISGVSQAMIRLKKTVRNARYSLFVSLLKKPIFWINTGLVGYLLFRFLPVLQGKIPQKMDFFMFPGLYNAGIYDIAVISSDSIRVLLISAFGVNLVFAFVAYSLLSLHKSRISDVVLIVQLILNIVIFKAVSQTLWLWNI